MKTVFNVAVFFLSALLSIWAMVSGWGLTAKSWPVIVWAVLFQFVLVCVHANVNAKDHSLSLKYQHEQETDARSPNRLHGDTEHLT